MTLHPTTPQCPVCKSAVDQSTIIPIYGRGRAAHDPRDKLPETDVPPRPTGRRIEARVGVQPFGVHPVGFGRFNGNAWGGYDVGVGGFGLFPSLFGLQIAYPQVEAERREEVAAEDGIPELVAKVFLLLAIFIAVIITTF